MSSGFICSALQITNSYIQPTCSHDHSQHALIFLLNVQEKAGFRVHNRCQNEIYPASDANSALLLNCSRLYLVSHHQAKVFLSSRSHERHKISLSEYIITDFSADSQSVTHAAPSTCRRPKRPTLTTLPTHVPACLPHNLGLSLKTLDLTST